MVEGFGIVGLGFRVTSKFDGLGFMVKVLGVEV